MLSSLRDFSVQEKVQPNLRMVNSTQRVITAKNIPPNMTMKTPPMLLIFIPPVSSSSSVQI